MVSTANAQRRCGVCAHTIRKRSLKCPNNATHNKTQLYCPDCKDWYAVSNFPRHNREQHGNNAAIPEPITLKRIDPDFGKAGQLVAVIISGMELERYSPFNILGSPFRVFFGYEQANIINAIPLDSEDEFVPVMSLVTFAPRQASNVTEVQVTVFAADERAIVEDTDKFLYIQQSDVSLMKTVLSVVRENKFTEIQSNTVMDEDTNEIMSSPLSQYGYTNEFFSQVLAKNGTLYSAFAEVTPLWRENKDMFGRSIAFYIACLVGESKVFAKLFDILVKQRFDLQLKDNFGYTYLEWNSMMGVEPVEVTPLEPLFSRLTVSDEDVIVLKTGEDLVDDSVSLALSIGNVGIEEAIKSRENNPVVDTAKKTKETEDNSKQFKIQ
jgi:hypothetical protein